MKRGDWKRLQQLELVCDGIAVVILHHIGLEASSLIGGVERITQLESAVVWEVSRYAETSNAAQRREFVRDVAAWITSPSRKDVPAHAHPPRR